MDERWYTMDRPKSKYPKMSQLSLDANAKNAMDLLNSSESAAGNTTTGDTTQGGGTSQGGSTDGTGDSGDGLE